MSSSTKSTKSEAAAPKARLTVKIGETTKDFFMSFGLLNELTRVIGDINRVGAIDLDADLALEVITLCLVERDERGRPHFDDFSVPTDLDPASAEMIFDWVKDHVMSFFIRRLKNTLSLVEQNRDQLTVIGSSPIGSQNVASKTA